MASFTQQVDNFWPVFNPMEITAQSTAAGTGVFVATFTLEFFDNESDSSSASTIVVKLPCDANKKAKFIYNSYLQAKFKKNDLVSQILGESYPRVLEHGFYPLSLNTVLKYKITTTFTKDGISTSESINTTKYAF